MAAGDLTVGNGLRCGGVLRTMRTRFFIGGGLAFVVIGLCAAAHLLAAPGGDLAKQQPKYHIKEIPPAPVRSPAEELKTFKLPPGFRMELLAAEPMVEEPIALTFDADGRIYVVELRAYMPDMAGTGELQPIGRIVRLEDSDGEGRIDKSTVFLDHLAIPRAVGLAGDGVLVAEPPTLWFCRDKDGDGKCRGCTRCPTSRSLRS
jgi:glucose/arabinose dehydrogenase